MKTIKKKNLLIYANGSPTIGGGHIMRQLALAQAATKHHWQVIFIYHTCSKNLVKRVTNEGFKICKIEQSNFIEQASKYSADAIVIDDYAISEHHQKNIKQLAIPVIYFDDQTDQQPIIANIIINSADKAKKSDYYDRAAKAQLCLGASYRVIRNEFLQQCSSLKPVTKRERILITLGDSDVKKLTLALAHKLLKYEPDLPLDIVIGSMTQVNEQTLLKLDADYPNLTIHKNTQDMSILMSQAGLAITTAGGTLYELALLGVPMAALCIVDNQIAALHSPINTQGYLGYDLRNYQQKPEVVSLLQKTINNDELDGISLACIKLWHHPGQRELMSKQLKQYIDGLGGQRVLTAIEQYINDNN